MAVSSYADTTVGVVFFNIRPGERDGIADQLAAAVRDSQEDPEARRRYETAVGAYLESHHLPLLAHEWCHILQAVAYPSLYLRCLRELQLCRTILLAAQAADGELTLPLVLSDDWLDTLFAATMLLRLTLEENGSVSIAAADPADRRPNDLTETDLLEEDASIFQYKVEIGGPGTGAAYSRWLRERGRYTMTFRFLSRALGEEAAYQGLPALVRASFSTSLPLVAFAHLVGFTRQAGAELAEAGADLYYEILAGVVEDWGLPTDPVRPDRPLTEVDFSRFDETARRVLIEEDDGMHPLAVLARHAWVERDEPTLTDFLFHPDRFYDRRTRSFAEEVLPYLPPMILVRVLKPEIALSDSVYVTSAEFVNRPAPLTAPSWERHFIELIAVKRLAFSLATRVYAALPHNCHHEACPLYPWDLCRQWVSIPKAFEECGFPGFLERATNHRLDPAQGVLEPLPQEVQNA